MPFQGVREYGVKGNQTLDPDNSETVTAAIITATDPWVGGWTRTRSEGVVRQLVTVLGSDATADGLGGTFTFEYSEDGSTATISEARTITDFQTIRDFDLLNSGEYFRVKFTPSRALASDTVIITTVQRRQNDGAFVRLADQQLEKANAAMSQTFAYLKGFGLDDRSADFPFGGVDPDNSSQTALTNSTVGTFTVNASTDVVTLTAHGLTDGTDLVLSTSDTLPAGLAVDTQYFVIEKTDDTFKLSATSGGSAIDITDTGTGTHTAKEPGTYTGTYQKTAGMGAMLPFAFGLQKLSVIKMVWSADGVTAKTGLLASSALTGSTTAGFEVYLSVLTTMVDAYVRIEVVNGSDDQTAGSFEIDTWFYSGPFTGAYNGLDATLSTLSTALLTRSVIAGTKPDGTFSNVSLGDGGELHVGDFGTEVARGNITGKAPIRIEARQSAVTTTEQVIWNGGGVYPFPTAAATVRVKAGGNTNDTAAGSGAREVTVEGLDSTGAAISETIATNGSSVSSATSLSFQRVNAFYVSQAGTYATGAIAVGSNTGIVNLETSGGVLLGVIPANLGRGGRAVYTVPVSKKGYFKRIRVSPEGSKAVTFRVWTRANFDDNSAPMAPKLLRAEWVEIVAESGFKVDFPFELMGKEDVFVTAKSVGGSGGAASVAFEVELVDDV